VIEQQGKILSVHGGMARVRLGGVSGCVACDSGKGCGAGLFGRLLRRRPLVLELENRVGAEARQAVVVGLPEKLFLSLVTRLYLWPLLAGLAGTAVVHFGIISLGLGNAESDLLSLAGGVAAAAAVIYTNRQKSREFPEYFIVHILRTANMHNPIDGNRGTFCEK